MTCISTLARLGVATGLAAAILGGSAMAAHADPGDPAGGPFSTMPGAGCSGATFRASQFALGGGGHIKVTIDNVRVLDQDFADSGSWHFDPPPHDGATGRFYRADFTAANGYYDLQQVSVGPCLDGPPPASLPPLIITPNDVPTDATVHPPITAPAVASAQAVVIEDESSAPAPIEVAVATTIAVEPVEVKAATVRKVDAAPAVVEAVAAELVVEVTPLHGPF